MKTRFRVRTRCSVIAACTAVLATLGGCKSGGQRLRELSAAHKQQWDHVVARHEAQRAACNGDTACLDAAWSRYFEELKSLMNQHNAEVLALVEGR